MQSVASSHASSAGSSHRTPHTPDPLSDPATFRRLLADRTLIVDGAMGTELDRRGVNTQHSLWSARALLEAPEQVAAVHRSYVAAGAQVLVTNSYQATVPGFEDAGLGHAQGVEAIGVSARLALEVAREGSRGGAPVLVAGAIGPFGAYLADGSEYTGAYPQSLLVADPRFDELHRSRIRLLAQEGIGVFALETLPRLDEARAIVALLREEAPGSCCWASFQVRADRPALADGTPLALAAAWAEETPQVAAIGVNCVAPGAVLPALEALREGTSKPLVAYPNSGERWDAESKTWGEVPASEDPVALAPQWVAAGARLVGGCCRTTPELIAQLSRRLG